MTRRSSWSETHALIVSTLKLAPEDRGAFLRRHCDDEALCEQLLGLLRAGDAGGDDPTAHAGPEEAGLVEGSHVGPYVVLHRLGRGGMGEVYLGRDPRLDRPVALKCLFAPRDASGDLRLRVIREARAAARITHPHVAAVHDVIEADGRAFIVMEYVEGQSLAVLLKREPLPLHRVVAIGQQLAGALAAAHAGGIIHRDLKPSNIQVMSNGSVKVLDFGIALAMALRATSTTRADASVLARQRGPQPGTPAYMAPEQLLDSTADERSDLFSLSLVLFEMATGRSPYPSTDLLDILLAAGRPLPRADAADHRVPRELADVIATGLAPEPHDRFQTAVEMSAALAGAERGLVSMPVPRPYPWRAWLARTFRIAAAAAAALLTVWLLGRVSSAGYNNTFERSGRFAWEPALSHVTWGAKSLVAPAAYGVIALFVYWALRFVILIAALSASMQRCTGPVRLWAARVTARLGLDDPVILAQGLAALGIVALATVAWRFHRLIAAWSFGISRASPGQLWPLGPGNEDEKVLYRAVLTWLLLAFSAGLIRVVHLRRRRRGRAGLGAAAGVTLILIIILLLAELPYRTMWQNKAPRVAYRGERCYVIGEADGRLLLHCPDTAPPRNRTVDSRDAELRPSNVIESVFSPRDTR